jgi:cell wall-associated NlpC family hydrolase
MCQFQKQQSAKEIELRAALVREALSWEGTPYKSCGRIRGVGTNCAQFVYAVFKDSGAIAADAPEPRWYTPQFALHSKEERLIAYLKAYGAVEIEEKDVLPGDVIAYKNGLSHGHLAIVVEWPTVCHCIGINGVHRSGMDDGQLARYSRRYFTVWKG